MRTHVAGFAMCWAIEAIWFIVPRPRAKCQLQGASDSMSLIASTNDEIWIVNSSDQPVDLKSMGLFGLSTGAYTQKPAGSVPNFLGWYLKVYKQAILFKYHILMYGSV